MKRAPATVCAAMILLDLVVRADQGCKPGQTKMEDCNVCTCLSSRIWACTNLKCRDKRGTPVAQKKLPQLVQKKPPPTEDGKCCVPNTTYMEECNVCLCDEDGIGASCTLAGCIGDWGSVRKEPTGE
ncbi:serine protease inhibitor I/II-like isoform X1 [Schistocerca serialis cubense]|uniref:serine protease inhibitor I/II-like isoform X1 n=1 Tax=Schistocerca serialis cubense TaxID=2023355 RepID=UPI00214DF1D3|nr:serine protease inhibitor I/II-like isoform X1 [Schistocerca serialis cubense]